MQRASATALPGGLRAALPKRGFLAMPGWPRRNSLVWHASNFTFAFRLVRHRPVDHTPAVPYSAKLARMGRFVTFWSRIPALVGPLAALPSHLGPAWGRMAGGKEHARAAVAQGASPHSHCNGTLCPAGPPISAGVILGPAGACQARKASQMPFIRVLFDGPRSKHNGCGTHMWGAVFLNVC